MLLNQCSGGVRVFTPGIMFSCASNSFPAVNVGGYTLPGATQPRLRGAVETTRDVVDDHVSKDLQPLKHILDPPLIR